MTIAKPSGAMVPSDTGLVAWTSTGFPTTYAAISRKTPIQPAISGIRGREGPHGFTWNYLTRTGDDIDVSVTILRTFTVGIEDTGSDWNTDVSEDAYAPGEAFKAGDFAEDPDGPLVETVYPKAENQLSADGYWSAVYLQDDPGVAYTGEPYELTDRSASGWKVWDANRAASTYLFKYILAHSLNKITHASRQAMTVPILIDSTASA
jgi:hypothetical protein